MGKLFNEIDRRLEDSVEPSRCSSWLRLRCTRPVISTLVEGPAFLLNYEAPPALVEFVGKLPAGAPELKGLSADSVLDAELAAKYAV